jgi:hypothetical protein
VFLFYFGDRDFIIVKDKRGVKNNKTIIQTRPLCTGDGHIKSIVRRDENYARRAKQLARFDTWPLISDNSRRLYMQMTPEISHVGSTTPFVNLILFCFFLAFNRNCRFDFLVKFSLEWFHHPSFFGFSVCPRADLPIKETNQQRTK